MKNGSTITLKFNLMTKFWQEKLFRKKFMPIDKYKLCCLKLDAHGIRIREMWEFSHLGDRELSYGGC